MKSIEEAVADAAVMALNCAVDAMCEAEAGMSSRGGARLLRLYGEDFAGLAALLFARSARAAKRAAANQTAPVALKQRDA